MGNTVLNLSEYKMKCAEVESLASAYTDCDLAEPVKMAVKRHAMDCLDCAELLNEVSEISEWASALGDLPLPVGVSARLRARLSAEENFGH